MKLLDRPADPVLDYFKVALLPYCTASEASEAAITIRETLSSCGVSSGWSAEMEVFMLGRMVFLFEGESALDSFFKEQGVARAVVPFFKRLIVGKISVLDGYRLIESRVLEYQHSSLSHSGGVWTLRLDRAIAEASTAFELGYIQVLKRIFGSLASLSHSEPEQDVIKVEGLASLDSSLASQVKGDLPGLLNECFTFHKAAPIGLIWAI